MTRDRRNRRRYRIRLFDYINQKTFFALLGVLIAVIAVLAYTSLRSTSEMNKLVKQTEELNHKFQQIYQANTVAQPINTNLSECLRTLQI